MLPASVREQRYEVPNEHHCQECHGVAPDTELLGPRTRQLDRMHDYGNGPVNQLDHMAELGLFDVTPPTNRLRFEDPLGDGPINDRARAYLDANCGHCHSQSAVAASTNFWLDYEHTDPRDRQSAQLGRLQVPDLGGTRDRRPLVRCRPGRPDDSILIYPDGVARAENENAPDSRPASRTRPAHAVMREWIAGMSGPPCD